MSNKYVVAHTTENPAYTEGAKMCKAVRWMVAVAIVAWLVL